MLNCVKLLRTSVLASHVYSPCAQSPGSAACAPPLQASERPLLSEPGG